jgi:hypothetical protein
VSWKFLDIDIVAVSVIKKKKFYNIDSWLLLSITLLSVKALPTQTIIVPPEVVELLESTRSPCPGETQVKRLYDIQHDDNQHDDTYHKI